MRKRKEILEKALLCEDLKTLDMEGLEAMTNEVKDWDIKGIAEGVIREMKEDGSDIGDISDYIQEVSWTVFSRDVDNADFVAEMVKKVVQEKYEMEDSENGN
jgi:hypothetical protein